MMMANIIIVRELGNERAQSFKCGVQVMDKIDILIASMLVQMERRYYYLSNFC